MSKDIERVISAFGLEGMRGPIDLMLSRKEDFPSPVAALLAGIGVQEEARRQVDLIASEQWNQNWITPDRPLGEVVIGTGPHALIYAAVRATKGVPVTLLDRRPRAGGVFALSEGPAFWLNSRNRPGELGLPGEGVGLNVLPGCVLQPSMVGGGEYQTNDLLAWVIRMNLMMLPNVTVHTGVTVKRVVRGAGARARFTLNLTTESGDTSCEAERVIIATGVGDMKPFNNQKDGKPDRLLNYSQFMGKMDAPFPLRGMKKVGVIGAGDSGKTVVESLLGQGPSTGMSVSALDFPEQIDWYGCPYASQQAWCEENRGRYNRIGKALGNRIKPMSRADFYPSAGFESVQIGPRIYDWVINCTGYTGGTPLTTDFGSADYQVGGRTVARRVNCGSPRDEVYLIGPAARIDLTDSDRRLAPALAKISDNATSLFRYAPMTATFANALSVLEETKPEPKSKKLSDFATFAA